MAYLDFPIFSRFPMPLLADDSIFRIELNSFTHLPAGNDGKRADHSHNFAPRILLNHYIGDSENRLLQIVNSNDWSAQQNSVAIDYPIVFCGPSGTGKTTLALELADRITRGKKLPVDPVKTNPGPIKWSGGDFAKAIRSAVDTDSLDTFIESCTNVAVAMIDNLQQLSGHPYAQSQLIRLIDLWHKKDVPWIVTLDEHPLKQNQLNDALVSRILAGLVLSIAPPGPAARRAIAVELANRLRINLPNTQLSELVDSSMYGVPLIHQRLLQMKSISRLDSKHKPNKTTISKLRELSSDSAAFPKIMQLICRTVATEFGISDRELKSTSRKQTTVLARGIAIYIVRDLFKVSFSLIGSIFSGRDHSTTIHAYRKIKQLIETDVNLANRIKRLEATIQQSMPALMIAGENVC